MKLGDVIRKTPEMSIEKLHDLLKENRAGLGKELNAYFEDEESILKEWDLIQIKQSKLSKSKRDKVLELVSYCLLSMAQYGE